MFNIPEQNLCCLVFCAMKYKQNNTRINKCIYNIVDTGLFDHKCSEHLLRPLVENNQINNVSVNTCFFKCSDNLVHVI